MLKKERRHAVWGRGEKERERGRVVVSSTN